jgi:hypothetical protein
MKTTFRMLAFISTLIFSQYTYAQKPIIKDRIKSITVLEEKGNTLVKKQHKESETYYDIKGNVTEEIKYKDGKQTKHFKYQYDNDGNKIKEEEFDISGDVIESSEYKYENGLRVEKIVYDENKKMKSRKVYKYTTY